MVIYATHVPNQRSVWGCTVYHPGSNNKLRTCPHTICSVENNNAPSGRAASSPPHECSHDQCSKRENKHQDKHHAFHASYHIQKILERSQRIQRIPKESFANHRKSLESEGITQIARNHKNHSVNLRISWNHHESLKNLGIRVCLFGDSRITNISCGPFNSRCTWGGNTLFHIMHTKDHVNNHNYVIATETPNLVQWYTPVTNSLFIVALQFKLIRTTSISGLM